MEGHNCRVYTGLEYYGRDIRHLSEHVVVCEKCGLLGSYVYKDYADSVKDFHLNEMKKIKSEKGI